MSWSVRFEKPVRKAEASAAIDALTTEPQTAGPIVEQLDAAKAAAKWLLLSVPGSHIMVAISGHANGIGWQKSATSANDVINVSVTQICDADIPGWAMK
jgi:hypothetical protein